MINWQNIARSRVKIPGIGVEIAAMIRRVDTLQVLQSQRPENFAINARAKKQVELATNLNFLFFFVGDFISSYGY